MKYNVSDYKLKVIVDELGEEYKELLIERILDDMHETDANLINPIELIQLDVKIKSSLRIDKKAQKQKWMHSLITLLGVSYTVLGLVLTIAIEMRHSVVNVRYDAIMKMAFVLMLMGIVVLLISLVLKIWPQYHMRQNYTISPYEVINKWKEIEAMIHELTPDKDVFSLHSMVTKLKETKIISEQDIEIINQLLNVRNQIVHGQDDKCTLSQTELRNILLQTDKIIKKMKKIV